MSETATNSNELDAILPDESSTNNPNCQNTRNAPTHDSKKKTNRTMCGIGILVFWILVGSAIAGIILSYEGLHIDIGDDDDFPSTLPPGMPPVMPPVMPPTSSPQAINILESYSERIIQARSIALSSDGKYVTFPAHNNVTQSIVTQNWKKPIDVIRTIPIGNYSAATTDVRIPVATSGFGNVQAYAFGDDDGLSSISYMRQYLGNGTITGFKNDHEQLSLSLSYLGGVLAVGDYKHKLQLGVVRTYNITNVTQRTSIGRTFGSGIGEGYGNAVSLTANGTTMAVGSFHYGFDKRGAVSVFNYSFVQNGWVQVGPLLEGSVAGENFGTSVSASGLMTVAIGGPGYGLDNQKNIGQCQIFTYNHTSDQWNKMGNSIIGDTSGAELGYQVALASQGYLVAISSKNPNMVRVYGFQDDDWTQIGGDFIENVTGFGVSLDLHRDILTVGATGDDDTTGGAIYIYDLHHL